MIAIETTNNWLEVTVKVTAIAGLAPPDVFYFGNTPGDTSDSATDTYVNAPDEIVARNNHTDFSDALRLITP